MDLTLKENNIIFIEETVFLEKGFYWFLDCLFKKLDNHHLTIVVEKNIEQLIENFKKTGHNREGYTLEGFLDILKQKNYLLEIDSKGYFETNEIMEIVKYNNSSYILLITQKENVYKSLSKVKEKYSDINLAKLENNQLREWEKPALIIHDAFYIENDIYINRVNIEDIDYVYSQKYGHIKLDKSKKFEGGEGILFRTYNNQLCKLYNDEHQTYVNLKKLQYMLGQDIFNPYINWPKDIIYYKNDFVGYVMDEIKGVDSLDTLRINMFTGYTIFDLYVLSYHLLLNIDYLHKKNILIGDLKLDNILVKSPEEVYLVDCGCYQIEDYSCDVCHPEYTKKIYTSEELKKRLRPFEEEYYPINKILFEILIGKNPNYNRDSGEVDVENKNNFYFPLDLDKIDNYTDELKMWRRLSNRMREYFYYYFKENKITHISEWIYELELFIEKAKAMKKSS